MMLNKSGETFLANGKAFTIGGLVLANGNSDYRGLYGRITEIRDGGDKDTENEGADIYCDFEIPGKAHMIAEIEARFSALYRTPKTIGELPLDGVIMAPEMLEPIAEKLPESTGKLYVLIRNYDGICLASIDTLAVSADRSVLVRKMFDDLEKSEEKEGLKTVLSHTTEDEGEAHFVFESAAIEESDYCLNYIIFETPVYGAAEGGVAA